MLVVTNLMQTKALSTYFSDLKLFEMLNCGAEQRSADAALLTIIILNMSAQAFNREKLIVHMNSVCFAHRLVVRRTAGGSHKDKGWCRRRGRGRARKILRSRTQFSHSAPAGPFYWWALRGTTTHGNKFMFHDDLCYCEVYKMKRLRGNRHRENVYSLTGCRVFAGRCWTLLTHRMEEMDGAAQLWPLTENAVWSANTR